MFGDIVTLLADSLRPLAGFERQERVKEKYPDPATRPMRVRVGDVALTSKEVVALRDSGALFLLLKAQERQKQEKLSTEPATLRRLNSL